MRRPRWVFCLALIPCGFAGVSGNAEGVEPAAAKAPFPSDEQLRQVLRDAFRAAEAVTGEPYDSTRARLFHTIAEAQKRVGDGEGAEASERLAGRLGKKSPPDVWGRAYSLRTEAFKKREAGDRAGALNDLRLAAAALSEWKQEKPSSNPFDSTRPITLMTWVAEDLAGLGDDSAARSLLNKAAFVAYAIPGNKAERPGSGVLATASLKPGALAKIAGAQAKIGDIETARFTLAQARVAADALRDELQKLNALDQIVAAQVGWDDRDAARATYRHAAEFAASIPTENQRTNAQGPLVRMLTRLGDFDEAFRIITEKVENEFLRESDLRSIVDAIEAGTGDGSLARRQSVRVVAQTDRTTAAKVLEQAVPIATSFQGIDTRARALNQIARVYVQWGDFDRALETVKRLGDGPGTEQARRDSLVLIRNEMARVREARGDHDGAREDWQEAVRQAEALSDERRRSHSDPVGISPRTSRLIETAEAQAQAENVDEALQTLALISDEKARAELQESVAYHLHAAKKRARGQPINSQIPELSPEDITEARRIADAIGPKFPKITLLRRIADAEARQGRAEEARRTRLDALELARKLLAGKPIDPTVPALSAENAMRPIVLTGDELWHQQEASLTRQVVLLQLELGDLAAAHETFDGFLDDRFRNSVRLPMVRFQAAQGDVQGALQWGLRARDPWNRLYVVEAVARAILDRKQAEAPAPHAAKP